MEATLRNLLPTMYPEFLEFEHWLIISHQGKSDLEASFPKKMREWREPGVRFIILRDNDGGDCVAIKQKLISKVPANAPEYLMRIVCQELEGWLLGDMDAVAAAYPAAARHASFKSLTKKDPDTLTNAAQLMKDLTGTKTKVARAGNIAKHMQPTKNRSTSFRVFADGLGRFLA